MDRIATVSLKSSDIFPVVCFTGFVLWLLAVVMDGPLLSSVGILKATDVFLPVHVSILLLLGLFCPDRLFDRLVPAGCTLTAALTVLLPFTGPSTGRCILAFLGATGAVAAVSACTSLRRSTAPLLSAAVGLVVANVLLSVFSLYPHGQEWQFAAVAVPLFFIPFFFGRLPRISGNSGSSNLWHYLLFIFVFQIVSGLMYEFMMPAYNQKALLPAFELVFYIMAVIAAYRIVRKNRDLALVCGVMLGMAAFTFLQSKHLPFPVNMGMFAMQAGAGFIDVVLIAVLLALPDPKRAFGVGLAAMCAGIFGGEVIGRYFADAAESIAMVGSLALNLSILTLYFLGRVHYAHQNHGVRLSEAAGVQAEEAPHGAISPAPPDPPPAAQSSPAKVEKGEVNLPEQLRLLLSDREYLVLKRALSGSTFRETSRELEISESTVKTYMSRIYEKMEVKGKKKLFEKLNEIYFS